MRRYRIVTDRRLGFKVQKLFMLLWFIPIWDDCTDIVYGTNSFSSIKECEEFINRINRKHRVIKEYTFNK